MLFSASVFFCTELGMPPVAGGGFRAPVCLLLLYGRKEEEAVKREERKERLSLSVLAVEWAGLSAWKMHSLCEHFTLLYVFLMEAGQRVTHVPRLGAAEEEAVGW
jgi:hypothetical protein